MNIGIIGLGRMGASIALRAINGGHSVIGYDNSSQARDEVSQMGATIVTSAQEVAKRARVVWLMVPIDFVDTVLDELLPHMKPGDIIIDGGNSFFKDSIRRAQVCAKNNISFLDCGTSGGVAGRHYGFCLMVGGDEGAFVKMHPLLEAIAAPGGMAHVGPSGTGHYVKMIHNGIEYGMLQAYAEGFQILKEGTFKDLSLDLEEISRIWNTSSIIRSYILDLAHNVFMHDQEFRDVSGEIAEGGTGKWTVDEAKAHKIPAPILEQALEVREWSRKTGGNYATKLVALLRNQFGGHAVGKKRGKK